MKKYAIIGLSILLSAVVWSQSFGGKKETTYTADSLVMSVGKQKIDVSHVMVKFMYWRNALENRWGAKMWKAKTGTDKDGAPITYEQNIKEDLEQEMVVEQSLLQMAKEKRITLTKEEKRKSLAEAKKVIKEYNNEELIDYGITVDKIRDYFNDISLITKLCKSSVEKELASVKESDFQIATIRVASFPYYTTSQTGVQTSVSDEKKQQIRKQARKAEKEIHHGSSLAQIAEKFKEATVDVHSIDVNNVEQDYSKTDFQKILHLKDGEYGPMIETEKGIFFVQMLHGYDEEKTKEAYEYGKLMKQKAMMQKYYKEKCKDKVKVKLEKGIWDLLPLASKK